MNITKQVEVQYTMSIGQQEIDYLIDMLQNGSEIEDPEQRKLREVMWTAMNNAARAKTAIQLPGMQWPHDL
jgi:hypothetical protein